MKVALYTMTPDIEETIVSIARVSSSRKDKKAESDKLLRYLIRNKHWSPFEHGFITFEIETSKAIGIQLLRHRSFTFQEFSQRYQNISVLGEMFESVELRKQAESNRQSSTEVFDPILKEYEHVFGGRHDGEVYDWKASDAVESHLNDARRLYEHLLRVGVAREVARMVLPMTTRTKIFMTGSVRSWIHFLNLRLDSHAQKEVREVAEEIAKILSEELPTIASATNNFGDFKGLFT